MFWRRPYEDLTTPREARAKNVNKKVYQRAEIVKIRQFPLQMPPPPPKYAIIAHFRPCRPFRGIFRACTRSQNRRRIIF